jgi:hypothetical protein
VLAGQKLNSAALRAESNKARASTIAAAKERMTRLLAEAEKNELKASALRSMEADEIQAEINERAARKLVMEAISWRQQRAVYYRGLLKELRSLRRDWIRWDRDEIISKGEIVATELDTSVIGGRDSDLELEHRRIVFFEGKFLLIGFRSFRNSVNHFMPGYIRFVTDSPRQMNDNELVGL